MTNCTRWAALAFAIGACADEGDIRSRLDVSDAAAETTSDASGETVGDSATPDSGVTDSQLDGETAADGTSPSDTAVSDGTQVGDSADTSVSDGSGEVVVPPWQVDPEAPWALGRPIVVGGSDGSADIAAPVLAQGRYRALVPARVGAGAVVADGRSFAPPDAGGHAAIVALQGDVASSELGTVIYVDGPLSAPERPRLAVCDGWVYATVNEQNGSAARLVRVSADLEAIDTALLTALPGLGYTVKLGPPVCGGPGVVATLDAVGGASFTAPDGQRAEFLANQTENKTLILNVTRVFGANAAQVVSAQSMRILQLVAGKDEVLFYVGEATVERQIGDTLLMPGDQLVYNHDYAVGSGGSIASQGWFGREDIALLATAADGRFAVAWVDVGAGATPADPELIEVVVSVFEADGARAWNRRSSAWAIDRIAFGGDGDLRVAGRFRSLEAIGVASAPVGLEDAFLAVLGGADGERQRHVVLGVAGLGSGIVGPIFAAPGSGDCADAGTLDAVMVMTGPTRVVMAVSPTARCASQALTAGTGVLELAAPPVLGADAFDFWLSLSGAALGADHGSAWPAGGALAGPLRGRLVVPL